MTFRRSLVIVPLALVAVSAFTVVRVVQVSSGHLEAHCAFGEAAIAWIVALIALVISHCQAPRSRAGWIALALVALVMGTSAIFPLWRHSRRDQGVVRLELGAVERDRLGPPVTGGRYDLTITPDGPGSYLVLVDTGARQLSFEGGLPQHQTISLANHAQLRAYLEFRGTSVVVEARPQRIPRRFLEIAALVAVLLASLADALTSRRYAEGVLTCVVTASVVFAVTSIEPGQGYAAIQVLGLVLQAVLTGMLAGAIYLVGSARLRKRLRRT